MEKKETISILIPTYNRELFIKDSINSILKQTYKNIKVLVYDDGSTDRTADIVKSISDERVQIKTSKINKGVSFARNFLLDWCDTHYAAWQDSDDISNIYRIQMQYNTVVNNKYIAYGRFVKLTDSTIQESLCLPKPLVQGFANASAMFEVVKTIRFDERLTIGEDNDWRLRMLTNYTEKMLDFALYYIRFHKDRLSVKYGKRK